MFVQADDSCERHIYSSWVAFEWIVGDVLQFSTIRGRIVEGVDKTSERLAAQVDFISLSSYYFDRLAEKRSFDQPFDVLDVKFAEKASDGTIGDRWKLQERGLAEY